MKTPSPRPSWKRLLLLALKTAFVGYLGVLCVLAFLENKLVYHPRPGNKGWMPPPIDDIQDVALVSGDGTRIHGWWLPCPESERTLLYLHGNAGNLSDRGNSIVKIRKLLKTAVLIIDYPGYGKSEGSPSETGCYRAAEAGYDWLVHDQKRDPTKLLLYGGSLGGAVAIDLATKKPHQALVVVKSFTSAPDVGGRMFPWIPVRWLMRNQFRSIDKIPTIKTPVFIAHGDRDTVVPYEHGEALYRAANEPKQFLRLERQDHNDALPEEFFVKLNEFLKRAK